ncbi:MAG: hypothetical protein AB7S44_04145 [Spirochaetales bacterium]
MPGFSIFGLMAASMVGLGVSAFLVYKISRFGLGFFTRKSRFPKLIEKRDMQYHLHGRINKRYYKNHRVHKFGKIRDWWNTVRLQRMINFCKRKNVEYGLMYYTDKAERIKTGAVRGVTKAESAVTTRTATTERTYDAANTYKHVNYINRSSEISEINTSLKAVADKYNQIESATTKDYSAASGTGKSRWMILSYNSKEMVPETVVSSNVRAFNELGMTLLKSAAEESPEGVYPITVEINFGTDNASKPQVMKYNNKKEFDNYLKIITAQSGASAGKDDQSDLVK